MGILNLLGKGVKEAPDAAAALRALTTFVGVHGDEGLRALREAGFLPKLPATARESAAAGARGVFSPPNIPARAAGPVQRVNLAPPSVAPPAPPVGRPIPPVRGVFDLNTPIAPVSRPAVSVPAAASQRAAEMRAAQAVSAPPAAPVPSSAPVASPNLVPLEGRQLDMFSGMNRLRYPAGTVTAEGTKVGGLTYNPADVFPEGAYTQRIRELARSKGIPEDLFIEQMQKPGESLAATVDFAGIQPQTGLFAKPLEFATYQFRNAMSPVVGDIGSYLRNVVTDPKALAALGITGVGTAGIGAYLQAQQNQAGSPGQQLTNAEAFPPATPPIMGDVNAGEKLQAAVDSSAPPRRLAGGALGDSKRSIAGQAGSGQVVISQNDQDSNYRQALANALVNAPVAPSDSTYKQIADYYKARQQYAARPETVADLARQAAALPGAAPETYKWATYNPTLAYEMIQRAKARPDLSQQTPQVGGVTVGAQMGDNPSNNFVGNVQAAGSAVTDRSSGAADLEDATRPLIRPTLNRVPLGGRMVPLGGAIPSVPFG